MLAERLPGILPGFRDGEAIETARIYSAAGEPPWPRLLSHRPFRAPHHSVTTAGLVGGGSPPRPGEISFAHGGVLFLDEFSEFRRDTREALRQPMEAGEIRIARAATFYRFPSRFLLVAATNPCPCGNHGHPRRICRCSPLLMARFAQKFSGPLLDRIDLSVVVPPLSGDEWCGGGAGEESAAVRKRVEACRTIQAARYSGSASRTNGTARITLREALGALTPEARGILGREADRNALSGRAIGKICRVARTIADLAGEKRVDRAHVAEAIRCRLPPFAAGAGNAPPKSWPAG